MGSKIAPSPFDCVGDAKDDEPMFTLLARDPHAPSLVRQWAKERAEAIASGLKPHTDALKVTEAYECASNMEKWRYREELARPSVSRKDGLDRFDT